jgi:hypothetical protein
MLAAFKGPLAIAFALISSAAFADDWTADKLRGAVLQLVDGQWQKLQRGMVVPDTRVIRTLGMGFVSLTRGGETIELGPNTQIQIFDKAGRKPFTTVQQSFGTVSVEANVENVQHFAVQTQYLAAVVKGTRFTVTSGKTGAKVDVHRGHVEVDDKGDRSHVVISVGQSATVDSNKTDGAIAVAGTGDLPVVIAANGQPVVTKSADTSRATPSGGYDNSGKGKSSDSSSSSGSSGSSGSGSSSGNSGSNSGSGGGSNSGGSNSGSGSGNSGSGNSGSGNSGNGNGGGNGSSGNGNGSSGNSSGKGSGDIVSVNIGGIHVGIGL